MGRVGIGIGGCLDSAGLLAEIAEVASARSVEQ
jgi:hypothetical protein